MKLKDELRQRLQNAEANLSILTTLRRALAPWVVVLLCPLVVFTLTQHQRQEVSQQAVKVDMPRELPSPIRSSTKFSVDGYAAGIVTVWHDDHLFVVVGLRGTAILHHPNCPCQHEIEQPAKLPHGVQIVDQ